MTQLCTAAAVFLQFCSATLLFRDQQLAGRREKRTLCAALGLELTRRVA
jgi:hypothetical protein